MSPIPSIRLTSPVPVKVQFLSRSRSRSSSCQVPVKFPAPRRVRSRRSDSTVQFQSRGKFQSRVKFLSSSWTHDESDPIDPTQKPKFQFPDPRRVRSHRSDSPVQFPSRSSSCQGQGPVPVPIPGSKSVPDSAIRVRSHRSD